eukprot:1138547-Pelagomonas_calceolata.AAC.2
MVGEQGLHQHLHVQRGPAAGAALAQLSSGTTLGTQPAASISPECIAFLFSIGGPERPLHTCGKRLVQLGMVFLYKRAQALLSEDCVSPTEANELGQVTLNPTYVFNSQCALAKARTCEGEAKVLGGGEQKPKAKPLEFLCVYFLRNF